MSQDRPLGEQLAQWTARHVFIPIHSRWERNGHSGEWRALEKSQWWSPDALHRLQGERLRALLDFCRDEVPFYRGMKPDSSDPWAALQSLPVVDKSTWQTRGAEFVATGAASRGAAWNATGGSTGEPLRFLVDRDRMGTRKAASWRHNDWAGFPPGTPWIALWGQPRDLARGPLRELPRDRLINRMIPVDASHLTDDGFRSLAALIRRRRIPVIQAYAGALALFTRFLAREGIDDVRVRSVVSSAEVLPPGTREAVARWLGAPIFERYGCREVSVVATECDRYDGLHVNAEHLIVEMLVDGRTARPGETGEIVVTDLMNRAQPFVRYRIGDLATPIDEPCPCGRGLPRIRLVAGRTTDFLKTPERGWVSGVALTYYLITNIPGVAQVRLEQDRPEAILLRARALPGATLPHDLLRARAVEYLGTGFDLTILEDPDLRAEGSGKFRFAISSLSPIGASADALDGRAAAPRKDGADVRD